MSNPTPTTRPTMRPEAVRALGYTLADMLNRYREQPPIFPTVLDTALVNAMRDSKCASEFDICIDPPTGEQISTLLWTMLQSSAKHYRDLPINYRDNDRMTPMPEGRGKSLYEPLKEPDAMQVVYQPLRLVQSWLYCCGGEAKVTYLYRFMQLWEAEINRQIVIKDAPDRFTDWRDICEL